MRVIKVLFLLAFFFVCMLFFVQNTAILETPLVLKLEAFGLHAATPGVAFYIVLLLAFVLGGLFATLYFLAEKIRLSAAAHSLSNKVKALEKQVAAATPAKSASPSYASSTTSLSTSASPSASMSTATTGSDDTGKDAA
jgi:lipopolysaccharide assembly protein A